MTENMFNQSVCRVPEEHILMRLAAPVPHCQGPTGHRTSDSYVWKGPCPKWGALKSWDSQVNMGFNTNIVIHDLDDLGVSHFRKAPCEKKHEPLKSRI